MSHSSHPGAATAWTTNLVGPGGQLFADPVPSPDETAFQVDNTSEAYYNSPYYTQHENDIEVVPTGPPAAALELESIVGAEFLAPIIAGNQISFHAVGDTGASSTSAISSEANVADTMTADLQQAAADAPAFLFHLGDVIYNFGEAAYSTTSSMSRFAIMTGRSSRFPETTTALSPTQTAVTLRTCHRCSHSSPTSAPPRRESRRTRGVWPARP